MKIFFTFIFSMIFFALSAFGQTKSDSLSDIIEPYPVFIESLNYNKIIFDNLMSEFDSYIDSAYNLKIKNKTFFTELKFDNGRIKILTQYPNVFFIQRDTLYRMDCRASLEDINSFQPLFAKQYFLQIDNFEPPELVIDWTESNTESSGFTYNYSGIKIIDLQNLKCLVDIVYSKSTEARGNLESESEYFNKPIELFNGFFKIGELQSNKSSQNFTDIVNDFKPGYYKLLNDTFRIR